MTQEVPVVCPKCERKGVENVIPNTTSIRHDGHREVMCKDCVTLVIGESVVAHGDPRDAMWNFSGARSKRYQTQTPNHTKLNEQ